MTPPIDRDDIVEWEFGDCYICGEHNVDLAKFWHLDEHATVADASDDNIRGATAAVMLVSCIPCSQKRWHANVEIYLDFQA